MKQNSKKLQRAKDYFNEKVDAAINNEAACQIAEYEFGQMLKDGIVVVEPAEAVC